MKLYSRSARNFLAFFVDSLRRRLQKENGDAPPSALKTRSLNLEHLENREYLSADGLVLGAIEIDVAPLDSLFVEVAQQTSVDAQPDLAYAFNVSQIDETEETFCESLDSLVFDESLAEFDAFEDDEVEVDFTLNGVDYVNIEKLDVRPLIFSNDLETELDAGLGGGVAGLMSGGGGEPIPYDVSISSTLHSVVADMSSATIVNPVLEQRELGSGGNDDPLDGADYLEVHLPALPYGYYGAITVTGALSDYSIYVPVGTQANSDGFDFSGGSSSSFCLLPKNNATPQGLRTVTAELIGVYPASSGGSTQEYDFYGVDAITMTIVDDDQWLITATTPNSIALETNPDTSELCVDGSFNVTRVANSTAQQYAAQSAGYYLDATYPITVSLGASGTATHGVDYLLKINNVSATSATITANATSQLVNVTPLQDRIFESDETVVLSPFFESSVTVAYDTASATVPVVIHQAPEFLSGSDSGVVNPDIYIMDFVYGKPLLGDAVPYAFQVLANRGYRFELVVDENNDYFEIDSSNNIVWNDFPSTEKYDFLITVKVIDTQYQTLYDTITVSVIYGWAALTVCTIQPIPGSSSLTTPGGYPGHAFWIIEATESLMDYCDDSFTAEDSINEQYCFNDLADCVNQSYGFYPDTGAKPNWTLLLGLEYDGKILPDDEYLPFVSAYASFLIPSVGDFFNGIVKIKELITAPGKYRLVSIGFLVERNCVDVTLEVAHSAGITNLSCTPATYGSYPASYSVLSPGPFGQTLAALEFGSYGAYTEGTTKKWRWI